MDEVRAIHCPDERPRVDYDERAAKPGKVSEKSAADHGRRDAALCDKKVRSVLRDPTSLQNTVDAPQF